MLLAGTLAAAVMLPVGAQDELTEGSACIGEVESNDSADGASSFAGEVCVQGTLVEAGDLDIFIWDVSAEDALATWSLELNSPPSLGTTVRDRANRLRAGHVADRVGRRGRTYRVGSRCRGPHDHGGTGRGRSIRGRDEP